MKKYFFFKYMKKYFFFKYMKKNMNSPNKDLKVFQVKNTNKK